MNQDLPNFEAWNHETLAKFATEAYLKLQAQHDLIQYLRLLIATIGETRDARKDH